MDALVGGEVEGKVSVVFALFASLRPQPQQARRQDLADLAQPLGGGHQVGVEGVVHRSATEARHSLIAGPAAGLDQPVDRLSLAIASGCSRPIGLDASAEIAGI